MCKLVGARHLSAGAVIVSEFEPTEAEARGYHAVALDVAADRLLAALEAAAPDTDWAPIVADVDLERLVYDGVVADGDAIAALAEKYAAAFSPPGRRGPRADLRQGARRRR